jgi:hypothetical protein
MTTPTRIRTEEMSTRRASLRRRATTALLGQRFGHGSGEHVEISAAEADRFVERVTQELRGTGW